MRLDALYDSFDSALAGQFARGANIGATMLRKVAHVPPFVFQHPIGGDQSRDAVFDDRRRHIVVDAISDDCPHRRIDATCRRTNVHHAHFDAYEMSQRFRRFDRAQRVENANISPKSATSQFFLLSPNLFRPSQCRLRASLQPLPSSEFESSGCLNMGCSAMGQN